VRTKLICALVSLVALLGAAVAVSGVEVPMARVAQLMSAVAQAPDAAREHVGITLRSLMDEILIYLRGQGLPEEALTAVEEGFSRALDAFTAGGMSQAEFGREIAALARELVAMAGEGGIGGLPAALLERIGLNPAAIEALRGEKDLAGLEIAALAQTIIGTFAPAALPAGPPAWVPAWGAQEGEGGIGGPPAGIPARPPAGIPGSPPAGIPGAGNDGEDDDSRGPPRSRP